MLVPRFWAKADGTTSSPDGLTYDLRTWAASPTSESDARREAEGRLARLIERVRSGRHPDHTYAYGRSVVREELVEEISAGDGSPLAIVTRNRYGALVLNAARTLFLDIDFPPDTLLQRLFARLRGRPADPMQRIMDRLRSALGRTPNAGFRIYQTAAGLRVMGTDREYDPSDSAMGDFMRVIGTDPSFVTLCRVQKSFRARLSPKPWRIGLPHPRYAFPFETEKAQTDFERWLTSYEVACNGWATCQLLEQLGPRTVHSSVAPVLEYHDFATRIGESLPLA